MNISVFQVLRVANTPLIGANAIAWIAAVFFAWVTARFFVFNNGGTGWLSILREIGFFFAVRFASGLLDMALMYATIVLLEYNELHMKILVNILVIIINYVASRCIFLGKRSGT